MLVRVGDMRGVNLKLFTFDYDLTWAGFFLNAELKIYGRFGGRDAEATDTYLTLSGLKYALRAALAAHRQEPVARPNGPVEPPLTVEKYESAQRLRQNSCIHCHHVHECHWADRRALGQWRRDDVWVYPLPENIGIRVDPAQGNRVLGVAGSAPADRAGIRAGDVLVSLARQPTASFADVQHALHLAPAQGRTPVTWQRDGTTLTGVLELADGWRRTDISWRKSISSLEPGPAVHGKDLTAEEKKRLGLGPKRLAFYHGPFLSPAAREAGIQAGDIILGIDDKPLELNARQFNAHVRLNYNVGDIVHYNVVRDGKPLRVRLQLTGRGP